MFRVIIPLILTIFLASGCLNGHQISHISGKGQYWEVLVDSSPQADNSSLTSTVRYIGSNDEIKDVHYRFISEHLHLSGNVPKPESPFKDITITSSNDSYSLNTQVKFEVTWNGNQKEEIILQ